MIHVALHWADYSVNDIALWPFAIKHAAWLYILLPNQITGISQLKMLTREKAAHKDLLRCHVWGCPTFVLNPKLHDGKKIPEWNLHLRLGQFLGFSDKHSTLVANVRHLTTGYVSLQYHCVFDDLFTTVFWADKGNEVTDALDQMLWENSRDL